MRWIVGVDVGEGFHGALGFVAWAARDGRLPSADLVAVHVLEAEHLRMVLRTHHLEEVDRAARDAAAANLDRHGVVAQLEIVQAVDASEGLAAEALRLGADALVVGRHAGLDGSGLGKLGRIARGALQDLAVPVIVVPHDLQPPDVGDGPVLAITSLGDDAVEAVRFARRFATWTGRRLAVAHAVRFAVDRTVAYLAFPPETLESHREERVSEGRRALQAWVAAHDIAVDDLHVIEGSVLSGAPRLARELRSPILVAGSRIVEGADRRLHTSIGTELAAGAPLAVAVVPPARAGAR